MRAAVGMNRNRRVGNRLGGDHPRATALAGNCNLDADDLSDQGNEVLQKLLGPVFGADLLTNFEQSTALFAAQAPAAWPGFIGWHNAMKSSGGKIIVPSLGIAAHDAPWVLSLFPCNIASRIAALSTSG
jgi:hypothetical protein